LDIIIRTIESVETLKRTGLYEEVTLKGPSPSMAYAPDLVDRVVCEITDRFELQTEGMSVIKATKILNISMWPYENTQLFKGQYLLSVMMLNCYVLLLQCKCFSSLF